MLRVLVVTALLFGLAAQGTAQARAGRQRPTVGVAFGGGSARGLAHVGVLRWFEEHRIPIDYAAGTSMGGLIGGAYASGMSSAELTRLLRSTDWDRMFGSSSFRYKNVRRKRDARAYPERLEFGYRGGVVAPPALNNGQQVEFLLARVAGAYPSLPSFDLLPTPFRCVALDLVSARAVVLDHGWLAAALRATMSLPGIFPPVDFEGQVLVDGGTMNNVPADVVRAMGADVVIAVPVGENDATQSVDRSLYALADGAVGAMMRANTRAAMQGADIIINPAEGFGSLDWRASDALDASGYAAAESQRDKLLPFALDEAEWAIFLARRESRRRMTLDAPEFVEITGATAATRGRMGRALRGYAGRPLDIPALEATLATFAGLDRYETVGWRLLEHDGRRGLEIVAKRKGYAPPFFMSGVSLQNTATDLFSFQLAARYLAFDVAGPESELRLDLALGARPNVGAALHLPIGASPFFIGSAVAAARRSLEVVEDADIVAVYEERRAGLGLDLGVELGRTGELRLGGAVDHLNTVLRVGTPGLPLLRGFETRARLRWLHDGQDDPVVPSTGTRADGIVEHIFTSPEIANAFAMTRSNRGLTRGELTSSTFWTARARDRLFLVAGAGTSFDGQPLLTEQFELGRPLHLGAYGVGEIHGSHYGLATLGYLWRLGRLPDFIGGPTFAGTWLENGAAFDHLSEARIRTNISAGIVASTLIGPAIIATSVGMDRRWRNYLGVGRLF